MTNKLLPVALVAALIGGSVGALVMNRSQSVTAETNKTAAPLAAQQPTEDLTAATFDTAEEQTAYKSGFADGFAAANQQVSQTVVPAPATRTQTRVVSRNTGSSRSSARRVYYDYQPQKRSFWDKHRDKLTVAIGTGAGAAVGGLIGGKKGAAIGALSGAGGSALWTYKLRNRDRSY